MDKNVWNVYIGGKRSFREPDSTEDGRIWYGPGGRDGDSALQVRSEMGRFTVKRYDNATGLLEDLDETRPFLSVETDVSYKELAEVFTEVRSRTGLLTTEEDVEDMVDQDEEDGTNKIFRVAAAWGVAKLEYYGGAEEFEESLP